MTHPGKSRWGLYGPGSRNAQAVGVHARETRRVLREAWALGCDLDVNDWPRSEVL